MANEETNASAETLVKWRVFLDHNVWPGTINILIEGQNISFDADAGRLTISDEVCVDTADLRGVIGYVEEGALIEINEEDVIDRQEGLN